MGKKIVVVVILSGAKSKDPAAKLAGCAMGWKARPRRRCRLRYGLGPFDFAQSKTFARNDSFLICERHSRGYLEDEHDAASRRRRVVKKELDRVYRIDWIEEFFLNRSSPKIIL